MPLVNHDTRAEIDNRTIVMLQTAGGSSTLVSLASLPALLEQRPEFVEPLAYFIGCNVLAVVVAIAANVSRRFTSLAYAKAEVESPADEYEVAAKRGSIRDWSLVALSCLLVIVAYALLTTALLGIQAELS